MPGTSSAHRQRIEIDGTAFLFQHGYRFGKVTYITRLPLGKSMTVFTPGHLSGPEVEAVDDDEAERDQREQDDRDGERQRDRGARRSPHHGRSAG